MGGSNVVTTKFSYKTHLVSVQANKGQILHDGDSSLHEGHDKPSRTRAGGTARLGVDWRAHLISIVGNESMKLGEI